MTSLTCRVKLLWLGISTVHTGGSEKDLEQASEIPFLHVTRPRITRMRDRMMSLDNYALSTKDW